MSTHNAHDAFNQLIRTILANIVVNAGCWEYPHRNEEGYGFIVWPIGNRPKKYYTHRIIYTAAKGPIAERAQIDHLCNNRSCCNPEHLEEVSKHENLRRITLRANGKMAYHKTSALKQKRRGK